jgi:hypothetical protein
MLGEKVIQKIVEDYKLKTFGRLILVYFGGHFISMKIPLMKEVGSSTI